MPPETVTFGGLRVLSLESRRGPEMGKLIENLGGVPLVAPSMREVPIENNREALEFASKLVNGQIDTVIFLTGVGTRALLKVVETTLPREEFVSALKKVPIVARGPKPIAVLRELGVPVTVSAPEPNTWQELLKALDENSASVPLRGKHIAVQEYGESNSELLDALKQRGASVTRVPVYDWQLPEDIAPLRKAIESFAKNEVDVALFTTSVQIRHLMQIAKEMNLDEALLRASSRVVMGSIGPMTSDEMRHYGFPVDLEPSHPKMGFLVREVAEKSAEILSRKRSEVASC